MRQQLEFQSKQIEYQSSLLMRQEILLQQLVVILNPHNTPQPISFTQELQQPISSLEPTLPPLPPPPIQPPIDIQAGKENMRSYENLMNASMNSTERKLSNVAKTPLSQLLFDVLKNQQYLSLSISKNNLFDDTNSDEMIGKFRVGMNLLISKMFMGTEDFEWYSKNKMPPMDLSSEAYTDWLNRITQIHNSICILIVQLWARLKNKNRDISTITINMVVDNFKPLDKPGTLSDHMNVLKGLAPPGQEPGMKRSLSPLITNFLTKKTGFTSGFDED